MQKLTGSGTQHDREFLLKQISYHLVQGAHETMFHKFLERQNEYFRILDKDFYLKYNLLLLMEIQNGQQDTSFPYYQ